MLVPIYAILRWMPGTRDGAERLGLVTRRAMVAALVGAIESPPADSARIIKVTRIRAMA